MSSANRYRVVGYWGEVPEQIRDMVGKPDTYLLYLEYRGKVSDQGFVSHGALVGGWAMEFAGKRMASTGLPVVPAGRTQPDRSASSLPGEAPASGG